jgi:hypothetical protein
MRDDASGEQSGFREQSVIEVSVAPGLKDGRRLCSYRLLAPSRRVRFAGSGRPRALFRGVFLQEQAVGVPKSLAVHKPVEDAIQRIGRLYIMKIPWKHEDRGSFEYGVNWLILSSEHFLNGTQGGQECLSCCCAKPLN